MLTKESKMLNTIFFEHKFHQLDDNGVWEHNSKNYSMKKMGDKFLADVKTYNFLKNIVVDDWLGSRVVVETASSKTLLSSMFPDTLPYNSFFDSRDHIQLEKWDNEIPSDPTARQHIDTYCLKSPKHKEFFLFHKSKTEPVFGQWNYDKTM